MKTVLIKLNVELHEIKQDVKHYGQVAYIKGTTLNSTTLGLTGQEVSIVFQLVLLVSTRIV